MGNYCSNSYYSKFDNLRTTSIRDLEFAELENRVACYDVIKPS